MEVELTDRHRCEKEEKLKNSYISTQTRHTLKVLVEQFEDVSRL